MAKKKAPAKTDPAQLPVDPSMFETDAGQGMEGADNDTYAIPFLSILQSNSPQVEDDMPEGAKAGLFINTITEELMEEVEIIPCSFQRRFLQWAPRSDGGGFRGEHNPIDIETGDIEGFHYGEDEKGKHGPMVNEDTLKDTRKHFVLMRSSTGVWQPALLSLASTQIKKSKRFMSLIHGVEMKGSKGPFNPPSFSHIYRATTIKEENNEGTWRGISISLVGPVQDSNTYSKAKAFYEQVKEGKVQTQTPGANEDAGGDKF